MAQDLCTPERPTVKHSAGNGAGVAIHTANAAHTRFNRATLLLLERPSSMTSPRWRELQGVCFEVVNHHCTGGGAQRSAVAAQRRDGLAGDDGGGPLDAPPQCRGNVQVLMDSLTGLVSFDQGGRVI